MIAEVTTSLLVYIYIAFVYHINAPTNLVSRDTVLILIYLRIYIHETVICIILGFAIKRNDVMIDEKRKA